MDTLPVDTLKIIQTYKDEIEHTKKFKKCIEDIKKIKYDIEEDELFITSIRNYSIYTFNKYTKYFTFD